MHLVDGGARRVRRFRLGESSSSSLHIPRHAALMAVVAVVTAVGLGGCGSDGRSTDGGPAAEDAGTTEPTPDGRPSEDATDGSAGAEGTDGTDDDDDAGAGDGDAGAGDDATGGDDVGVEPHGEPTAGDDGGEPRQPPQIPIPPECPEAVRSVGDRITDEFEYVEVPPTEDVAILTCDWRDTSDSIASVEVSFSHELVGTDLADVDGAQKVTVAGMDGYVLRADEGKVRADMFQFQVSDVYITGGSIQVEGVAQGDILELAEAAVEALPEPPG
ncbi:hypothetical protein [Phytoactinopolyspora halotolerans]|uniref:Uncharacterized protein n=1 Tax=Phytoactinopolyspora halotolerans TaxID=1981512 RepID=A0A6L9SG32_9ACTN|nr:hypothetical protein [Phytoactinopolyspora halotolerans]NEE04069.1 hypothetical protein [Phytoactinopolyspora halotolerans]